jgi:DNA (cytosine-5)-methyltransferase 1
MTDTFVVGPTERRRTYVPSESTRRLLSVRDRRAPRHARKSGRTETLRSLELFAGAGGLALGLNRVGFEPSLLVDFDPRSCETLRANGSAGRRYTCGWPIKDDDVRHLDYGTYEGVDLLSAGAPCQPFSIGGRLRAEGDDRNMFPEAVRAVREVRPRAFVLENVRGLLFSRARPYFDYLVAELRAPSRAARRQEDWQAHYARLAKVPPRRQEYRVHWRLLNAADYGVGQNRPRLVIVGIRADQGREWTWPEPTHSRDALIAALHADHYWDEHGVARAVRNRVRARLPRYRPNGVDEDRWRTLRDLTRRLGPPSRSPIGNDPAHVHVPGARLYTKHTGSTLDWPAKTVKAGVHGCPGGEHIVVKDNGSYRYLTVRECASLQGFPTDYALPEARGLAMRQLGNAVPVPLAEAVGTKLREVLGGR